MINFAVHQVRAGQAGASGDFEQMLGLLVRATSGSDARLVFANPGDWGIDVLVGDLNGRVSVWQAKYFAQGVGRSQEEQIRSSFASAVRAAASHGYMLDRWVLCIPVSMDGPATQWWQGWKAAQERASGVTVELWDETRLRELLLRPESADVYRHYYVHYAPFSCRPHASGAGTGGVRGSLQGRVAWAAEELAVAVADQWRREESLRRVQDPGPLPVRWTLADPLLSDHMRNVFGDNAVGADLDGGLREVAQAFTRVPSRRLVVVGAAGAGKTVFTLRLTLDLLTRRQPGDPVPVIFGLHSWNPLDQSLQDWLAARLDEDYPFLRAPGRLGQSISAELVSRRLVLPVLDGLDEVSQPLRGDALRTLNMSLDRDAPVIVTCREPDYRQITAESDVLTSAAVIQLQPLRLADLADYLPRTTRIAPSQAPGRLTTKWDPVLERMRAEPGDSACGDLLEVLASPLMTSLARCVYSETAADPGTLLDGTFTSRQAIEDHLLDGFVPAAFAGPVIAGPRPGRRSPRAHDARRWLGFLARHLERLGTRDLEWWRLEAAVPLPVRWLPPGLVALFALCAGSAIIGPGGWQTGIPVVGGAAAGFVISLALITSRLPPRA
jgi:GTPase SAR1 family protein